MLLVIAILFNPFENIWGQVNHVLNYSFEKDTACTVISSCPLPDNIQYYRNWYCPSSTFVDWFSYPCFGSSGTEGVPQNDAGYQFARTGRCYAGIEFSETGPTRGYITGTLSDSLIPTKKYCVTFYVNLGDSVWWAISAIGAYLSSDSICAGNNYNILPYTPQVENPSNNILTDKVNWVPVSSEYTASGGEIFITIGDFYSDTLSKATYVGNGGTVAGWQSEVQSYYYVDDVYVRELTIANAGKADTICNENSVLIGKDTTTPGVSFSWLPTAGLSNPAIAQPMASPTVTTTYTLTVVNDSIHGCNCKDSVTKDSVTIYVNPCLGIDKVAGENESIGVYPNPNNGVFTISLSHAELVSASQPIIEVYNILGEKIYNALLKQVQGDNSTDLTGQPNGIYLYRVVAASGELIGEGKIIVQR